MATTSPRANRVRRATVYYAHAMCIYRRREERDQLRAIRRGLPRRSQIVNPAVFDGHPEKLADTIGFCLRLVEASDAVVFSRLVGKISAGVGREINHALKKGKPVFEVSGQRLVRRTRRVTYISRRATISLYERWRYLQCAW